MRIEISDYLYDKCVNFANDRIDNSKDLYKYRGESRVSKMIEDIVVGTAGEYGAYQYLKLKGIKVGKPDLKIYEAKRKSFDSDLHNEEFKFHVKSQSVKSHERYGPSWLLQRNDKIVKNPADNEYIIFTKVDGKNVDILGIVKIRDIVDAELWGECKVPHYRYTKVALYLDDLWDLDLRRF